MATSTADPGEVPAPAGLLARLRTLRILDAASVRDFRLLWASEGVSVLGDQFHAVALSWLVISLTGSGLALGTVLIAVSVPRAILLLPMGVLADRRPPRSLMLASHAARAVIVAAIAALVVSDNASIPALAALGVLFGAADAVFVPSMQAFVPGIVAPRQLPSANALLQGTMQVTGIAGPPIAGLVVAAAGTGIGFGVDAASFAIAGGLLLLTAGAVRGHLTAAPIAATATATGTAAPQSETFVASLLAGLRYVIADRAIAIVMLVSLVLNFALNGPAAVGIPWLAELRYHAGAPGLGLLVAGWAVGGLVGTLAAGSAPPKRIGRIMLAGLAGSGLAVAAAGLAPTLAVASLAFVVGGLCVGYVNILAISWLQARVEHAMLGRVMSLVMLMGFGISPLSMAVAGVLVDVNATATFVGAGVLIILTTLGALALGMAELLDVPSAKTAPSGAAPGTGPQP